jgi:hypothetical protein
MMLRWRRSLSQTPRTTEDPTEATSEPASSSASPPRLSRDGSRESEPRVSVCLLAFNHEEFISQAIESVLAQVTDFEVELIIGEDDSTDRTRSIVQRFATEHPDRIRLLLNTRDDVIEIDGVVTGRRNLLNTLAHAPRPVRRSARWRRLLERPPQAPGAGSFPRVRARLQWRVSRHRRRRPHGPEHRPGPMVSGLLGQRHHRNRRHGLSGHAVSHVVVPLSESLSRVAARIQRLPDGGHPHLSRRRLEGPHRASQETDERVSETRYRGQQRGPPPATCLFRQSPVHVPFAPASPCPTGRGGLRGNDSRL